MGGQKRSYTWIGSRASDVRHVLVGTNKPLPLKEVDDLRELAMARCGAFLKEPLYGTDVIHRRICPKCERRMVK